jgi:multiple sugar transport system permease protein
MTTVVPAIGETKPESLENALVSKRPDPPRTLAARVGRWIVLALLVGFSLLFMYPFVWLISASLKPREDVFDNKLIPDVLTFENYLTVWQDAPLLLWLGNTVLVTVLAALAVTITSSMVAWAFAYYRFPGRNVLFGLVLASMMLPGAVTMIPVFLIWDSLGQVDTLTPLWAGNLFGRPRKNWRSRKM